MSIYWHDDKGPYRIFSNNNKTKINTQTQQVQVNFRNTIPKSCHITNTLKKPTYEQLPSLQYPTYRLKYVQNSYQKNNENINNEKFTQPQSLYETNKEHIIQENITQSHLTYETNNENTIQEKITQPHSIQETNNEHNIQENITQSHLTYETNNENTIQEKITQPHSIQETNNEHNIQEKITQPQLSQETNNENTIQENITQLSNNTKQQEVQTDITPMKTDNSSENTSFVSCDEDCEKDHPLALIIGQAGNGKTFIMSKIFGEEVSIELFKPQLERSLKYYFVDTSSFDFESDYDYREEQIENYKKLFKEYPNRVRSILIVVNFERTDLMKKKVLNINKYFQNFKNIFSLVITKFHLSENIERDKEQLRQSFKFLQVQNMIFVGDDTKKNKLFKDLKEKSLPLLEDDYEFDLKDTLFEEDNEEELTEISNILRKKFC